MVKSTPDKQTSDDTADVRRAYVSQSDVPRYTVNEALRVAIAINDNYGKQPTKPLRVADALKIAPTTGTFRNLTSASVAYGLTEGTAWATEISLTELGRRIVSPTEEGADATAKVEAAMRPRVIREFLRKYDGSKFPPDYIAVNVITELGVPRDAASRALSVISRNADELGLLRDIKGHRYVDLAGAHLPDVVDNSEVAAQVIPKEGNVRRTDVIAEPEVVRPVSLSSNRRVFITHGRNHQIVTQLKELLTFGNFEPVVAIETEALAKPVPDKVLDEMRSCGAAIVHVGAEQKLLDAGGLEVPVLNPNVLIEIGAAMALFGRRFILLVEKGVTLPSNLQGLYEVRFEGSKLDYEATMKLLKAFNDFKS
jgi:hypothetical protein